MNSLAQALAIATTYIASRPARDDDEEDNDVAVLEGIAALLQSASVDEVSALDLAASRLSKEQQDENLKAQYANLLDHLGLRN